MTCYEIYTLINFLSRINFALLCLKIPEVFYLYFRGIFFGRHKT